jgi:hypothetical protein
MLSQGSEQPCVKVGFILFLSTCWTFEAHSNIGCKGDFFLRPGHHRIWGAVIMGTGEVYTQGIMMLYDL